MDRCHRSRNIFWCFHYHCLCRDALPLGGEALNGVPSHVNGIGFCIWCERLAPGVEATACPLLAVMYSAVYQYHICPYPYDELSLFAVFGRIAEFTPSDIRVADRTLILELEGRWVDATYSVPPNQSAAPGHSKLPKQRSDCSMVGRLHVSSS